MSIQPAVAKISYPAKSDQGLPLSFLYTTVNKDSESKEGSD